MPLVVAHATLDAGARFEAAIPADFEMAAYVIEGSGRFGETGAHTGEMVIWKGEETSIAFGNAGDGPLQVMIIGGTPAEGPLVFHGPFVMNNVEQVRAAEVAYRTGRMGTLGEQ
jgi:redox-sensitive bicupin YhaK (pirin superfamily)